MWKENAQTRRSAYFKHRPTLRTLARGNFRGPKLAAACRYIRHGAASPNVPAWLHISQKVTVNEPRVHMSSCHTSTIILYVDHMFVIHFLSFCMQVYILHAYHGFDMYGACIRPCDHVLCFMCPPTPNLRAGGRVHVHAHVTCTYDHFQFPSNIYVLSRIDLSYVDTSTSYGTHPRV